MMRKWEGQVTEVSRENPEVQYTVSDADGKGTPPTEGGGEA